MSPSPSHSPSPPLQDDSPPATATAPATLPLPLSASLVLTALPQDASAALAKAADDVDGVPARVTIRFRPVGSAPALRQAVVKVNSANRFETVVSFLGRKLKGAGAGGGGGGEGVFCYVNSVFAPGLDEGVGGLWKCFKTDDQLIVAYSMTPAFG